MFSQCKPDQPVAVGPVGQLFTTGPVGPCGMVSNHELHDPIADSPVGLTETPDPVDETERSIQIEYENSPDRRAGELGRYSPFK